LEKRLDSESMELPNLEFELTLTSSVLGGCLFVAGVSLAVTCRCWCKSRGNFEEADERARIKDSALRSSRQELALYRRREEQWLKAEQPRLHREPRQALYIPEENDDDDIQPSANVFSVPRGTLPPPVLLPALPINGSLGFANGARRRPSSSRVGGDDNEEQFEMTNRGDSVQPASESSLGTSFLLDSSATRLLAKVRPQNQQQQRRRAN
jgi:hypothetical protein